MGRVLILSDREDSTAQLRRDAERMGHSAAAAKFDDAAEAIYARQPDIIISLYIQNTAVSFTLISSLKQF